MTTTTVRDRGAVVRTHTQSDGYASHYRLWGRPEGDDAIVLLHGGVSHSGWQAPLAEAVVAASDLSFLGLDRRGSGLNTESRGHLLTKEREIEDVVSFLESLRRSYARVHLAGWCFGGQVATIAASEVAGRDVISSLVLVAPGFVFNERYGDVLRLSIQAVFDAVRELGATPEPTRPFVPVPLQPTDFTTSEDWLRFVADDELRLTRVTERTVVVWFELAEWSRQALSALRGIPVLAVFGSRDRLVDNERVKEVLTEQVVDPAPTVETLDAGHAIQFEEPDRLAELVTRFVAEAPR